METTIENVEGERIKTTRTTVKDFKPREFQFLSADTQEAGTMWLRVNNKTHSPYFIETLGGDSYATIPPRSEIFIETPIPIIPARLTGFPDYVRTTSLLVKNKDKTNLLLLKASRDGQNGTFGAILSFRQVYWLYYFSSPYNKAPQQEIIRFDPTKGKDSWVIQLTLKGENLVDSKIEILSIQK